MDSIEKGFADHARVLEETKALIPVVREMADVMSQALHQGHKILICGNAFTNRCSNAAISALSPIHNTLCTSL